MSAMICEIIDKRPANSINDMNIDSVNVIERSISIGESSGNCAVNIWYKRKPPIIKYIPTIIK